MPLQNPSSNNAIRAWVVFDGAAAPGGNATMKWQSGCASVAVSTTGTNRVYTITFSAAIGGVNYGVIVHNDSGNIDMPAKVTRASATLTIELPANPGADVCVLVLR